MDHSLGGIRHNSELTNLRTTILVLLAAVGLTIIFWRPLWGGGGLIGGDVYSYFLPQKTFYADRLDAGELPLWNNRVGHGYPLVGESQTGVFYPFYLIAYSTLDVNTAYNAVHLLHYVLTFVFTWLYARKIGLSVAAAMFAALVFTYGWFPTRSCWEWAIVTGAYLPLTLWCVESFLLSGRWRYLILMSTAIGLQLLAGHYNLAFITHLVLAAYVPMRLWFARDRFAKPIAQHRNRAAAACAAGLIFGFALAAAQLLPTWELKQQSQRSTVGGSRERTTGTGYDPAYGHLPPLYLTQAIAPWFWYSADIDLDQAIQNTRLFSVASGTNKIEAHLYFGLLPLALILWGLYRRIFSESTTGNASRNSDLSHGSAKPLGPLPRLLQLWGLIGIAAVIYATGWLVPVTRYLPGFSFFGGPGRFGIVTTLAVAILAAAALDRVVIQAVRHRWLAVMLTALLFAATVFDTYWVSQLVTNTVLVQNPAINLRDKSEIAQKLHEQESLARMFAPGANLATLTGIAATPVYLGIGPAAYFDPDLRMPSLPPGQNSGANLRSADGQVEWLQRAGVTHVLSFAPLDSKDWPVKLISSGPDALLSPAWGRPRNAPLYVYELQNSRGRVAFEQAEPGDSAKLTEYAANRVVIESTSASGGRLILTDLMYPGWTVRVDGQPAKTIEYEQMFRAVDVPPGEHTVVWNYEPASVYCGIIISLVAMSLLAALAHLRYWHPRLLPFFDEEQTT